MTANEKRVLFDQAYQDDRRYHALKVANSGSDRSTYGALSAHNAVVSVIIHLRLMSEYLEYSREQDILAERSVV